jgi:TolB-like protein/Tfp pilus assembly protein PilF
MSSPAHGSAEPRRLGPYLLLEPLGEGRFGVVYRARDERTGRIVALRVLPRAFLPDDAARRRFRSAALALFRVHHPGIIDVLDVYHEGEVDAVASEYVEGETLAVILGRGRVSEATAARIASQVAEALAVGHERAVVHRHLNPRNVIVTRDGTARIADFGLPRSADDAPPPADSPRPPLDRLAYAAPEQVSGRRGDGRADLYALGVILYQMLTGERPHQSAELASLSFQIAHTPAPPLTRFNRQLSPAIEEVVLMCLEKEPGRRYLSGLDLSADLRRLDAAATGRGIRESMERGGRLWSAAWVSVGLLVVLVVLLGLDVGRSRQRLLDVVLTGQTGGPLAGDIRTVAVLPLHDLTRDEDHALTLGVAEELTALLARVTALRVVSVESGRRLRSPPDSLIRVGRELLVGSVITGTVRRTGDHVHISMTGRTCSDGREFWSRSEEIAGTDAEDVIHQLAKSFLRSARVPITDDEHAMLESPRGVRIEPWLDYLRGRAYVHGRTPADYRKAAERYRLAIAADTMYAPAYAAMATLEIAARRADWSAPDGATCQRVQWNALRALTIDALNAEALAAYAWSLWQCSGDPVQADRQFQVAVQRLPSDPLTRAAYAAFLGTRDRFEERLLQTRRALECDPLSPEMLIDLARCQLYLHDVGRARRLCMRALEIDPGLPTGWATLARVDAADRQWPEALQAQRTADSLGPRTGTRWIRLRMAVANGDHAEADRLWRPISALIDLGEVNSFDAAVAYLVMGHKDLATSWLARAYADGTISIQDLRMAPELDSLRTDERFVALMAKLAPPRM